MIRINLLPYRAQRRQSQILEHIAIAGGAVVLVLIVLFSVNFWAGVEYSDLQEEFGQLKQRNAELKKQIGKIANLDKLRDDVEKKLQAVDELQKGRFRTLITLNGLASVIPENVWLTSLSETATNLSIEGLAESNKAVANFMRALDESPLFGAVSLGLIERDTLEGISIRRFNLTVVRLEPNASEKDGSNKGSGS